METGFLNSIFPHKAVPYWVLGRLTALCHRPGERRLRVQVPPPVETHDSPETLLLFALQKPREAQVLVSFFSVFGLCCFESVRAFIFQGHAERDVWTARKLPLPGALYLPQLY